MGKVKIQDVWHQNNVPQTNFNLGFVPYDGYYPLLRLPMTYNLMKNQYFEGVHRGMVRSRITHYLHPLSGGQYVRYKGRHGSPMAIYAGFLSAMGMNSSVSVLPSHILDVQEVRMMMTGNVDVFCLALIKMNDLPDMKFQSHGMYGHGRRRTATIEFNTKSVKILISTDKLKKTAFTNSNYTATVRRAIYTAMNGQIHSLNLKVEEVSDEYIGNFIQQNDTVSTNSIVEIMQMDNQIKESVFTNLNKAVV